MDKSNTGLSREEQDSIQVLGATAEETVALTRSIYAALAGASQAPHGDAVDTVDQDPSRRNLAAPKVPVFDEKGPKD